MIAAVSSGAIEGIGIAAACTVALLAGGVLIGRGERARREEKR